METCPNGLLVLGQNRTILHANAAAAQMLGMSQKLLTGTGAHLFLAGQGSLESITERLPRDGCLKIPAIRLRRNGKPDFLADITAQDSQFGGQQAVMLWIEEITERHVAEETMNRLFDSAPLPMMLCDASDGAVRKTNRRAAELFFMGQKLANARLQDIVGETKYRSFRHHLHEGGYVDDFEIMPRTAYGEEFPATLSGQIVYILDERYILLSISDITERKLAEETLRRFFEAAPLAMLQVRLHDHALLKVNRRASELLNIHSHETRTNMSTMMDYLGSEAQAAFMERLQEGGFVDAFEARLATDYGESIWAILSGQIVDMDNERCVLVGVIDITDRKMAEEDLQLAQAKALRATEEKSMFLATMSHEIRTPMNGVLGMLDVLACSDLRGEEAEMVEVVCHSARTLLAIIDDILDFSKIEAGRLKLERVGLSVRDLMETAVEMLATKARDKGLRLVWHAEADVPNRLFGDPTRLRQILINLLSNAVKFTATGGKITVHASLTQADSNHSWLRVEVQDDGIGMTAEQQADLFKPFTQADLSTTRHFGGTGLGLSICQRLLTLMGGDIGVVSHQGKGSLFWIELPFEADLTEQKATEPSLAGLHMLAADPLPETLHWFSGTLAPLGARMLCTTNVEEALELLDQQGADLVIFDQDGGFEALAAKAKSKAGILTLPTTYGRQHDDHVLAKPARSKQLVRWVLDIVGRTETIRVDTPRLAGRLARGAPSVAEALASGRLILVAEDNFTNRLVIGKQLARLGYACEMAEDGEAAWEALLRKPYALLLTDCSMPRLDGYSLSRRIRHSEGGCGRRLPILALTAHALEGDSAKCIEAGMDDYLSKPISLEKLGALLEHWMPNDGTIPAPLPLVAPPPVAEHPIDLTALGQLLGEDDPSQLQEIIQSFIDSFKGLMPRLHEAISAKDRLRLRDLAHAAKGAARNVCAPELAMQLEQLEHQAPKRLSYARLSALLNKIEDMFGHIERFAETPLC
jgi:PAS domain S-box-containing protein